MSQQIQSLPFGTIEKEIENLLEAFPNKIEREWNTTKWANYPRVAATLVPIIKVSSNTYKTILYFCADIPPNIKRKPEYALSVPPLARTIFESLCTVVFLFENLPKHTEWFYKAGWRELYEDFNKHKKAYGNDPMWKQFLDERFSYLNRYKAEWGITQIEESNPENKIKRWPTPGKMINTKNISKERKDYINYLIDWFYKELSQDSHLSFPGLARRSKFLLYKEKLIENEFKIYRSQCIFKTITILLALLSEIEIELNFNLVNKLKYVWEIINSYYGFSKELYDFRYANLL